MYLDRCLWCCPWYHGIKLKVVLGVFLDVVLYVTLKLSLMLFLKLFLKLSLELSLMMSLLLSLTLSMMVLRLIKFDIMIEINNNTMSLLGGGGVQSHFHFRPNFSQTMVTGAAWRRGHGTNPRPNPRRTSVIHGRISSQNWLTSNICKNSVFWQCVPHLITQGQISDGFYLINDSSMNDTNTQGVCL